MDNLKIWNAIKQPPASALKQIMGGRLKGKTDISPQWRYKVMTEQFGVCGVGWKYEVSRVWNEPAPEGQVLAFAEIRLYIEQGDSWSDPIPGIGGSMLVEKEQAGLHTNDEAYKMAITDALSVAMKMLGVGADIYAGLWDGTKYADETKSTPGPEHITEPQQRKIFAASKEKDIVEEVKLYMSKVIGKAHSKELTKAEASQLIEAIDGDKIKKNPKLVNAALGMGAEIEA